MYGEGLDRKINCALVIVQRKAIVVGPEKTAVTGMGQDRRLYSLVTFKQG